MIGASSSAFAGNDKPETSSEKSIAKINEQIENFQNKINIAQEEVRNTNELLKKNEQEISAIFQNFNTPNPPNALEEVENILLAELNCLRNSLDQVTAKIVAIDGAVPDELKLQKKDMESKYNKTLEQVEQINSEIKNLILNESEKNSQETKLKNLLEDQSKYNDYLKKSNDIIKNLQSEINNLTSNKLKIENKIKNNSKIFSDWNKYLSGNQFVDNMLNGEREANACWLFCATNVINHFNCIVGNKAPIQGFQNVVKSYFEKCGNKMLVGDVEYIIEYLKKFDISTYNLSFENDIKNLNDWTAEKKEQINNIKEFIVKYFTTSQNPAPILNLNSKHWLTLTAYDDIENKLLVVDSATGTVEWKPLDLIIDSAINFHENKIIWQLLFSFKNKQSDSDYFSEAWDMPLTQAAKNSILKKIREF